MAANSLRGGVLFHIYVQTVYEGCDITLMNFLQHNNNTSTHAHTYTMVLSKTICNTCGRTRSPTTDLLPSDPYFCSNSCHRSWMAAWTDDDHGEPSQCECCSALIVSYTTPAFYTLNYCSPQCLDEERKCYQCNKVVCTCPTHCQICAIPLDNYYDEGSTTCSSHTCSNCSIGFPGSSSGMCSICTAFVANIAARPIVPP